MFDRFYDYTDCVVVVNCCSGCDLIWKKAIAINSMATQMRRNPMKTIVKNAPTSNSKDAVENNPTFVFAESAFNDFLAKKATSIAVIHTIASIAIRSATKGRIALMSMFVVTGVNPERLDQLPFQLG